MHPPFWQQPERSHGAYSAWHFSLGSLSWEGTGFPFAGLQRAPPPSFTTPDTRSSIRRLVPYTHPPDLTNGQKQSAAQPPVPFAFPLFLSQRKDILPTHKQDPPSFSFPFILFGFPSRSFFVPISNVQRLLVDRVAGNWRYLHSLISLS